MSDEIEFFVLEIKITHIVVSCCFRCSFCQKQKDLLGHYPFCFAECVLLKQLFENSGLVEPVELLLEDYLVAIGDPVCAKQADDKILMSFKINQNSNPFWLPLRFNYCRYCKFNHFLIRMSYNISNSRKLDKFQLRKTFLK